MMAVSGNLFDDELCSFPNLPNSLRNNLISDVSEPDPILAIGYFNFAIVYIRQM